MASRVKTFVNDDGTVNGRIFPGDLDDIQDDYEYAYSSVREIVVARGGVLTAPTTAVQALGRNTVEPAPFGNDVLFWFDPNDYIAVRRDIQLRIRVYAASNQVDPGCTFSVEMFGAVIAFGASGSPNTYSPGVTHVGSAANVGALGASGTLAVDSPWFSGFTFTPEMYLIGVTPSAAMAAGSKVDIVAALHLRQV